MSREGRHEMDKLFRYARAAGYGVVPANASARQMLVTHPSTGEWERIATNPGGRQVANERAKMRRIGAPVTEQDLKLYQAVQAAGDARGKAAEQPSGQLAAAGEPAGDAAEPAAPEPAAPAPRPAPAQFQQAGPEPAAGPADSGPGASIDAGEATRDPFIPRPARHRPTLKDTTMTRSATNYATTATTTVPGPPGGPGIDVASTAYVLWGSIRERVTGPVETLDGVPGVAWRGTLSSVFRELWPSMGVDYRKRINLYLRETENMICLKKGPTPLWWLRGEWRDISAEPASVIAVRTRPRPPGPRLTDGPPAAVTVIRPGRDTTPAPAGAGELSGETTQAYDAVAAVTAILRRCSDLEAQNAQLAAENAELARLAGDLEETRAQLAAIRAALSGLTG